MVLKKGISIILILILFVGFAYKAVPILVSDYLYQGVKTSVGSRSYFRQLDYPALKSLQSRLMRASDLEPSQSRVHGLKGVIEESMAVRSTSAEDRLENLATAMQSQELAVQNSPRSYFYRYAFARTMLNLGLIDDVLTEQIISMQTLGPREWRTNTKLALWVLRQAPESHSSHAQAKRLLSLSKTYYPAEVSSLVLADIKRKGDCGIKIRRKVFTPSLGSQLCSEYLETESR